MQNPLSYNLQEAIINYVKRHETCISDLDTIALMILAEYPDKEKFCQLKPYVEHAIVSGFSSDDLQLYSEQLPKKQRNKSDKYDTKRQRRKRILNRIDVYWYRILSKCFPPTNVRLLFNYMH